MIDQNINNTLQKFLDSAVDLSNLIVANNFEDRLLDEIEGSYKASKRWGSINNKIENIVVNEYKIYLKKYVIPTIVKAILPELLKNDWINDPYIKELVEIVKEDQ